MFTAALVATAAAFSSAQVPLMIEVPDSGHIVRVGDFHPRQALGDLDFDGGVTPSRRNAIKVFGRPDGKDPRGCPNKWKSIGLRMLAANFGGGSQCASSTRIQKLYAKGPNWQTERGLKIGDSLDRVRELYPELMSYREWLDTSRREYRNHWVLVFEPSEINGPPGVERLSIVTKNRLVTAFEISIYGAGD